MIEEENMRNQEIGYPSTGYTEDALRLRLDTTELIEKIEMFLKGERLTIQQDQVLKIKMGTALANEEGIQHIVQTVNMIVTKEVVQGNLDNDEINQIVYDVKLDLAWHLMTQCEEWGVDRNNRRIIVHNIERLVKIFLSRTKDNKERESYGMRVVQSSSQYSDRKKGISLPFKN